MLKHTFLFLIGMILSGILTLWFAPANTQAQVPDLKPLILSLKQDARGPYESIRWFCPDGTVIAANARCKQPGGNQHAILKPNISQLQTEHGIYLGQIFAGTPFESYWETQTPGNRLKQYQVEKFLRIVDNGWIHQRSQFYRGALQMEDEAEWGERFLQWLLSDDTRIQKHFYELRETVKDIPHLDRADQWTSIRALATQIASAYPAFMDLRIKIHGQPEEKDIETIRLFRKQHQLKLNETTSSLLNQLEQEWIQLHQSLSLDTFKESLPRLLGSVTIKKQVHSLIDPQNKFSAMEVSQKAAELLYEIRLELQRPSSKKDRLSLMTLSLKMERLLFQQIANWHPQTLRALFAKNAVLAQAATGAGFLELWEWGIWNSAFKMLLHTQNLSHAEFQEQVDFSRKAVEWGTGMVRAAYDSTVSMFAKFEPLAGGFIDERIRSSVLLPWGDVVRQLADQEASLSGLSNQVFDLKSQSQTRGLNPGFALGELEVITGPPEGINFSDKKIYIMLRPPYDLKPVSGIATVTEGNTVSHVQLLARNLGIPNAVISQQMLKELLPFTNTQVFYAVSPRGSVRLKSASFMTEEEKTLVLQKKRNEDRVRISTDRIDLTNMKLVDLYAIRSLDSGRICGPKAANLGQLNALFPGTVAPGFIIPFSIFRQHMNQPMPQTSGSYWQFLQGIFLEAEKVRQQNLSQDMIDQQVLQQLAQLRDAVQKMPLSPDFIKSLAQQFLQTFNKPFGSVPLFVRSDTNMEDLKEFVGAGLNLTVPNVVEKERILQAIRDVWASPFRERSYRWRQKYLLNPEDVYPSLLLLQSVNVQKSGVMITTGLESSNPDDMTVAFNWGVAGAVDGQAAESYLLQESSEQLLSPAREAKYLALPETGGVHKLSVTFDQPILNRSELLQLRQLGLEMRRILPAAPGMNSSGPFDIELGFLNGKIWLFQARPFVENKRARASTYLNAMDASKLPDTPVSLKMLL
ncbi:MAG: phosphoenolpyruvate synthase [SAR324 cluster bacterium]|nr:phosphoenolpyruvate synthase [SAR324 cluster bacterium]